MPRTSRYRKSGRSYRKSSRRSTARKTYRKKKAPRWSSRRAVVPRVWRPITMRNQGLPKRINVRLPYFENAQLIDETAAVTYMEAVYRLNSCFAPNAFSGAAAHQPRGFDQWSALYDRYLVKGCSYSVEFYAASATAITTAAANVICGTVAGPEGVYSQFASIGDIMEYPKDKFLKVRTLSRNTGVTTSAASPYSLRSSKCSGYINMQQQYKMYRGIDFATSTVNAIWPQDFSAVISATPGAEIQLCCFAASQEQNDTALLVLPHLYANVRLVYDVEFYDPVYAGAS